MDKQELEQAELDRYFEQKEMDWIVAQGEPWFLDMYEDDDEDAKPYRLTDKAEDCWTGVISRPGGDIVMDLEGAAAIDWKLARDFAERLCREHNRQIGMPDFPV